MSDFNVGLWFQSVVSGLWYRHRESAGDICAWKEDGVVHAIDETSNGSAEARPTGKGERERGGVCCKCGHETTVVRPGKEQCDYCENREAGEGESITETTYWRRWIRATDFQMSPRRVRNELPADR